MTEYLKQAPWHSKAVSADVRKTVSEMLARIDADPEGEIRRYSRELDGWDPESFIVDAATIERAAEQLEPQLREHIAFAQDQVRTFAQAQRDTLTDLEVETLPGVVLGHRHIPVQTVGSYVPGGRYPMLASSFMTVVVPKVAGVERVIACAPPRAGEGIHPAMLHAMHTSGADDILALGGVQALAAMTYGIEGLPEADVIVGAGNAYVAEAKRQLFGQVGIDILAGPTQVAVIADASAHAPRVALDRLGQAAHGPTSPAVLTPTSRPLGAAAPAPARAHPAGRADHHLARARGGRARAGRAPAADLPDRRSRGRRLGGARLDRGRPRRRRRRRALRPDRERAPGGPGRGRQARVVPAAPA